MQTMLFYAYQTVILGIFHIYYTAKEKSVFVAGCWEQSAERYNLELDLY